MNSDSNSKQFRKTGRQISADAISGYNIIQELGKGSTGSVFRAVQMSMNREVALKILHPRLTNHDGFKERFQREAQMAGAVHHPNVITCFDAGESQGYVFQALELLDGGDLRSLSQQQQHNESQIIDIMLDCTRGLEAIHDADLNHGDIDPSNIFLSADGEAKLGDLGLARSMHGDRPVQHRHIANDASAFIAPECHDPQYQADIRSDIFSLGAVMYYLLTGQAPLLPHNELESEWYGSNDQDLDPRNINPDISAGAAAIVRKAIAPQIGNRYMTPGEMREDLERVHYNFSPIHASRSETGAYKIPQTTSSTQQTSTRRHSNTRSKHKKHTQKHARQTFLNTYMLSAIGCLCLVLFWLLYIEINKSTPSSSESEIAEATASNTDQNQEPEIGEQKQDIPVPKFKTPSWATAAGQDDFGLWADLKIGPHTQRMRHIKAGQFLMGAHSSKVKDHHVTLSNDYWIADTEMSQAMYEHLTGTNPSRFKGSILPVESVSWQDAQGCLEQLNATLQHVTARLPTEAEWEYACADEHYHKRQQRLQQLPQGKTSPIASFSANKHGLYDTIGNVKEWVLDAYSDLSAAPVVDPLVERGLFHVARGSAWSMSTEVSSIALRTKYQPVKRFFFLGFRFVIEDK